MWYGEHRIRVLASGEILPTPYTVLDNALRQVLHGDWTIRKEMAPSARSRKGARPKQKPPPRPVVIHILLAEAADVTTAAAALGAQLKPQKTGEYYGALYNFVYDAEKYARFAHALGVA